jgi:hypothetical protein
LLLLDQPAFRERDHAFAGHNEMIEHADLDKRKRFPEAAGDGLVSNGWGRRSLMGGYGSG